MAIVAKVVAAADDYAARYAPAPAAATCSTVGRLS
jgi:hypothetical protein